MTASATRWATSSLIAVAERMKEIGGHGATIARLGGDEFALIIEERETAEIVALGEELSRNLGIPFLLGTTEVSIGGSVGIVIAPEDGRDSTVPRPPGGYLDVSRQGRRGAGRRSGSSRAWKTRSAAASSWKGSCAARSGATSSKSFYQPFMASDGESLGGR